MPENDALVAITCWMFFAVVVLVLLGPLLSMLGPHWGAWLIIPSALYVGRQGHYALWPRTAPKDLPGATLLLLVPMGFVTVLVTGLPRLLGLPGPAGSLVESLVELVLPAYVLAWQWRLIEAKSPRIRAIRLVVCFAALVFVGVAFAHTFGVEVQRSQVQAFYSTVATVEPALFLAVAFQSGWARDRRASRDRSAKLEAFVLLAGGALTSSFTCSLIAIGRGADSATLFAFTIVGLGFGIVLAGLAVVQNIAPDLLGSRSGATQLSVPYSAERKPREPGDLRGKSSTTPPGPNVGARRC